MIIHANFCFEEERSRQRDLAFGMHYAFYFIFDIKRGVELQIIYYFLRFFWFLLVNKKRIAMQSNNLDALFWNSKQEPIFFIFYFCLFNPILTKDILQLHVTNRKHLHTRNFDYMMCICSREDVSISDVHLLIVLVA